MSIDPNGARADVAAALAEWKLTTLGYEDAVKANPNVFPATHNGKAEALALSAVEKLTPTVDPPVLTALRFPAAAHYQGGNFDSAAPLVDICTAASVSEGDPIKARLGNPALIALVFSALNPFDADWRKRQGFSYTYGGGLSSWQGANDTLQPNPQGVIRAFQDSDFLRNADGSYALCDNSRGFDLSRPETVDLIAKAIFYSWKLQGAAAKGWNGNWSDNVFWGDYVRAGWAFGPNIHCTTTQWTAGMLSLAAKLHALMPGVLVGGNKAFMTNDPSARKAFDIAMHENLDTTIGQGPDYFAQLVAQTDAWYASGTGPPRYLLVIDRNVKRSDTKRQAFGLALATLLHGAYITYENSDSEVWFPADMTRNGKRGYLEYPVVPTTRSGGSFSGAFTKGRVTADFGTGTGTFA